MAMNTYVIWGLVLPYVSLHEVSKEAEAHMDGPYSLAYPELLILSDGMSEEYTIIGTCIAKSHEDQGFDNPIRTRRDKDWRLAEQDKTKALMMQLHIPIPPNQKFEWITVSHYR